MQTPTNGSQRLGFGLFEADLSARELYKRGVVLHLQDKPFQILTILLERPGEAVSREELSTSLWPDGTCVDFDEGLNTAIKKLRFALGDSADTPTFIETIPRRGYRFVAPVTTLHIPSAEPPTSGERQQPSDAAPVPSPLPSDVPSRKPWLWLAPVLAGVLASSALVGWIWAHLRTASPREPIQRQLTTNSSENLIESAILSPDGKYLLFGDRIGLHARLIATGETHTFKRPADLAGVLVWFPNAWFRDGARFVAVSVKSTAQGDRLTSWLVTILGGATTLLRDDADAQAVSPDGSLIAFTTGGHETDREVWVMGPQGENPRRIRAGGELTTFRSLQWSPRGRRLAYSKAYAAGNDLWEYSIESCDLKGEAVTVIVPGLAGQAGLCWLSDGRIIYSIDERAANNENTNLWEIRADPTTGQAHGRSHSITNWLGIHTDRFSFSADEKRMVIQKSWGLLHAFIGRLQANGRLETPRRLTLEDSHEVPLAWTADSKAVIFSSDRTGVWKLYGQALDQAQAEPLTTGPDENRFARLSPDGHWALYSSKAKDGQYMRYLRVPLSGGPPELVMQTTPTALISCPVSPATECILTEWSRDRKETILTSFDPLTGRRHILFKLNFPEHGACCIVSPDGSEFAVLLNDPHESRVRLLSHRGEIERDIPVRGWANLNSVDWAGDGQSLFVSSGKHPGSTLLRVDRSGRVEPLWTCSNWATRAIQSRDGRYLALLGYSSYSNAWLLEDF